MKNYFSKIDRFQKRGIVCIVIGALLLVYKGLVVKTMSYIEFLLYLGLIGVGVIIMTHLKENKD